MKGPPKFVAGSGVCPGGAWRGMKQIPPRSLRSLVGMARICGWARIDVLERGAPSSYVDSSHVEPRYVTGLNLFVVGIV
jgi:hypothetical protein